MIHVIVSPHVLRGRQSRRINDLLPVGSFRGTPYHSLQTAEIDDAGQLGACRLVAGSKPLLANRDDILALAFSCPSSRMAR